MRLVPDDLLAEYASGTTSPGVSLLVAAQLTRAADGRGKVREYESVGGAMLIEEEPVEMSPGSFETVLAAIDLPPDAISQPIPRQNNGPLPTPVIEHLGVGFDQIDWKFRLPGVSSYDLSGFGDEKVQLLRARPGSTIPQHTHRGVEMTLVLQGILEDDGIAYCAGDVAINDEEDDHRPRVLGDEVCYCLIVQRGDLHFTGRFGRILNLLGE